MGTSRGCSQRHSRSLAQDLFAIRPGHYFDFQRLAWGAPDVKEQRTRVRCARCHSRVAALFHLVTRYTDHLAKVAGES
jgi:hypothetical protein